MKAGADEADTAKRTLDARAVSLVRAGNIASGAPAHQCGRTVVTPGAGGSTASGAAGSTDGGMDTPSTDGSTVYPLCV